MGYTYFTNKFGKQKLVCSKQTQIFLATYKSYTIEVTHVYGGFDEYVVEVRRKYYGRTQIIESVLCQSKAGAIAIANMYQHAYFQ